MYARAERAKRLKSYTCMRVLVLPIIIISRTLDLSPAGISNVTRKNDRTTILYYVG